MPRTIQPSFAAGELAPSLSGRVDLAKYHVGARTLRNFIVHPHGGTSNRPGTLFLGEAPGPARLIPFGFNAEQAYALVFTEKEMRLAVAGGFIAYPADTAIPLSPTTPISGGDYTGFPTANAFDSDLDTYWQAALNGTSAVGNSFIGLDCGEPIILRKISFVQGAKTSDDLDTLTQISSASIDYSDDGLVWTTAQTFALTVTANSDTPQDVTLVASISAQYWRLTQRSLTDPSGATPAGSGRWSIRDINFQQGFAANTVVAIATPYAYEDLAALKFTQSADVMFFVHPKYPPYRLTRYSHTDWVFTPIVFTITAPTPANLAATFTLAQDAPPSPNSYRARSISYKVSAVMKDTGQESLPSPAVVVDVNEPWTEGSHVALTWDAVPGAISYNIYKSSRGVFGLIMAGNPDDARLDGGSGGGGIEASSISSGDVSGHPKADAFDSDEGTYWGSSHLIGHKDGAGMLDNWLGQNLGSAIPINGVRIMQGNANHNCVDSAALEYSADGTNWTLCENLTLTVAHDTWQQVSVNAGKIAAQYWRVRSLETAHRDYRWIINELEFHALGVDTPNAPRLCIDDNVEPDTLFGPQTSANPFDKVGKYPGAVAIFQQRLVLARTDANPQSLWMTRTGDLNSMAVAYPTRSDDAIEITLASRQIDEIRHLLPLEVLMVLTSGAEWKVSEGSNSDAITPLSIMARLQGYRGCAHVPPIVIGQSVLFVQRVGDRVYEMSYQLQSDSRVSSNVCVLAPHLFANRTVREWAYQQSPDSVIWCVMSDGAMLGFTYLKEQEVWAWTHHDTDGAIQSTCGTAGFGQDDIYFVVKRTIENIERYYVERLVHRIAPDDSRGNAGLYGVGVTL